MSETIDLSTLVMSKVVECIGREQAVYTVRLDGDGKLASIEIHTTMDGLSNPNFSLETEYNDDPERFQAEVEERTNIRFMDRHRTENQEE